MHKNVLELLIYTHTHSLTHKHRDCAMQASQKVNSIAKSKTLQYTYSAYVCAYMHTHTRVKILQILHISQFFHTKTGTHTYTLSPRTPKSAKRERGKEDRLLAFKTQKVLMLAIDWYLSSVRWGECMHNHNYRGLWSLIYSRFIFVDAFHLYSLALWTWKGRFPFTLLRSVAACCHITFVSQFHSLPPLPLLPLSLCISIHPSTPPSIKSIHISGKLPCPLIEDTLLNI